MAVPSEPLPGPPPTAANRPHGAGTTPGLVRFDGALRAKLAANLRRLETHAIAVDARHHAAVAVVVVDSEDDGGEEPAGPRWLPCHPAPRPARRQDTCRRNP